MTQRILGSGVPPVERYKKCDGHMFYTDHAAPGKQKAGGSGAMTGRNPKGVVNQQETPIFHLLNNISTIMFQERDSLLPIAGMNMFLFSLVVFKGNLSLLDIFSFFPGGEKANGSYGEAGLGSM